MGWWIPIRETVKKIIVDGLIKKIMREIARGRNKLDKKEGGDNEPT
jgi:hypothetical protein